MTVSVTSPQSADTNDVRLVISASALGTLIEWYDFFLYIALSALLATLFFPSENPTAAFLASLATVGAGFGVRPLGAFVFGVLGDRIGRKYTFLITLTLMGVSTAAVGFLPTYASAGMLAPILLVTTRMLQGLALGGEYGGAAIYVAEHAPMGKRGLYTSWIQASVVGGFLMSIGVVLVTKLSMSAEAFASYGWRIPFLLSILMLAVSLFVRLKLRESPVFQKLKERGEIAQSPLRESFASWAQTKMILAAMMGIAAGFTVIWYTAQFSTLSFLRQVAQLDDITASTVNGIAIACAVPFFIVFGWLSDRIGRKKVMITGYVLTLILLVPVFKGLAHYSNPALAQALEQTPLVIRGPQCEFDVFARKQSSECGNALGYLTQRGLAYTLEDAPTLSLKIGPQEVPGFSKESFDQALVAAGFPKAGEAVPGRNLVMTTLCIFVLCLLSAMTYGPVAAYMVELFPARVRYTSMSVPYHIGTGYFGGFLPFVSQLIVVKSGNPFAGLSYSLAVVAIALVVCAWMLPETHQRAID